MDKIVKWIDVKERDRSFAALRGPSKLGGRTRLTMAFAALAMLWVPALAQEETAGSWMERSWEK